MKIKLRDLTEEQYEEWKEQNCCEKISCEECIFNFVNCICGYQKCWIKNKDLFNDKFLNQEIEIGVEDEVEGEILNEEEKTYLSAVIKPFRDKVDYIGKMYVYETEEQMQVIEFKIVLINGWFLWFTLPTFGQNKEYNNMELKREYTLEELGL